MNNKRFPRRSFLKQAALGASLFSIVPRRVLGGPGNTPPSETLRVAGVGCGGQAMHDLGEVSREAGIVALADVDWERGGNAFIRWPQAKAYKDYRRMLDEMADSIDAVVVATPDHVHAPAAMAAMQLGKHVYVEKPMAHNITEAEAMRKAAAQYKVVTQMGNQGHSGRGVHKAKGWVEQGILGDVTEVHCWTNRPTWPQGQTVPKDSPPIPEKLDWDLWLGPAQPRPYNPAYCPRNWRGWWDFGTGALGDMGCHILDLPFYTLNLGAPSRISAESGGGTEVSGPLWSIVRYEFPKRGAMPPVTLTWHDGGKTPPRPSDIPEDERLGAADGGSFLLGAKATLEAGTYGGMPKVFQDKKELDTPKVSVERSYGHHVDWARACKTGADTVSNFDYAAPLTKLVLLGNIAIRMGQPIEWDDAQGKVTNLPEANALLDRKYREGWHWA